MKCISTTSPASRTRPSQITAEPGSSRLESPGNRSSAIISPGRKINVDNYQLNEHCIYVYIIIHICTYVYTYYIHIQSYTYIQIYIYIYTCIYVTYIIIYIHTHTYIYIYIYIYLFIYRDLHAFFLLSLYL